MVVVVWYLILFVVFFFSGLWLVEVVVVGF